MYSGLLPPGLSEADLSSDADEGETAENTQGEQLSHQSDTEPHSSCVQVECNNTKTGLHNDAFGEDCLPGVSLDKWQVRELIFCSMHQCMHACMYVCMYVCYVCMYACMQYCHNDVLFI